jgi:hypothetical protein
MAVTGCGSREGWRFFQRGLNQSPTCPSHSTWASLWPEGHKPQQFVLQHRDPAIQPGLPYTGGQGGTGPPRPGTVWIPTLGPLLGEGTEHSLTPALSGEERSRNQTCPHQFPFQGQRKATPTHDSSSGVACSLRQDADSWIQEVLEHLRFSTSRFHFSYQKGCYGTTLMCRVPETLLPSGARVKVGT